MAGSGVAAMKRLKLYVSFAKEPYKRDDIMKELLQVT